MKHVQIFFTNDTTQLRVTDPQADGLMDHFTEWHNYEPGLLSKRPVRVASLTDDNGDRILIDVAAIELLHVYSAPDAKLEHLKTHEEVDRG